MSDRLSKEEIAERAERISQLVIETVLDETDDLLVAVVALEAAKLAVMHGGRMREGSAFTERAEELLHSFDGFDELAEALSGDAMFLQPGGES